MRKGKGQSENEIRSEGEIRKGSVKENVRERFERKL
jgi:hypothetical protein